MLAILLLGVVIYPGTFTSPHLTPFEAASYEHAVVPEGTEAFDTITAASDPPTHDYEDLSPKARELFDLTREGEPEEITQFVEGESVTDVWRVYRPTVCRDFLLVCDGHRLDEFPLEFTYTTDVMYDPEIAYDLIVDGDERYLLRTGELMHGDNGDNSFERAIAWLALLPFVGVIGALSLRNGYLLQRTRYFELVVGIIAISILASIVRSQFFLEGFDFPFLILFPTAVFAVLISLGGVVGAVLPHTRRVYIGVLSFTGLLATFGLLAPYLAVFDLISWSTVVLVMNPIVGLIWIMIVGLLAYQLMKSLRTD